MNKELLDGKISLLMHAMWQKGDNLRKAEESYIHDLLDQALVKLIGDKDSPLGKDVAGKVSRLELAKNLSIAGHYDKAYAILSQYSGDYDLHKSAQNSIFKTFLQFCDLRCLKMLLDGKSKSDLNSARKSKKEALSFSDMNTAISKNNNHAVLSFYFEEYIKPSCNWVFDTVASHFVKNLCERGNHVVVRKWLSEGAVPQVFMDTVVKDQSVLELIDLVDWKSFEDNAIQALFSKAFVTMLSDNEQFEVEGIQKIVQDLKDEIKRRGIFHQVDFIECSKYETSTVERCKSSTLLALELLDELIELNEIDVCEALTQMIVHGMLARSYVVFEYIISRNIEMSLDVISQYNLGWFDPQSRVSSDMLLWLRQERSMTPLKVLTTSGEEFAPLGDFLAASVFENNGSTPLTVMKKAQPWAKPFILKYI